MTEKKDDWMTLEDLIREVIGTKEGDELIKKLMAVIPEQKKEKYRKLWKELKKK